MIGAVEASALKDDSGGLDQAMHLALAFRANADWLVIKPLPTIKTNAAAITLIGVQWHGMSLQTFDYKH